ncbi:hypothetical protein Q9233_007947 [Columba guinea]|nr:hypothetical protein Q9233_007947 [Columba guinea]
MLTWLQATITGYLLLVLEGSFTVKELTERRVAAEGSSVLMDAPDIKNVKLTEWEYIRNTTSELILQYYANSQSPTIYPAYQSKLIFFKENGSILLQRLQETDSGIYKATVDLKQGEARTTFLEVISLTPNLRHVQRLAIVALMLVTFSAISFIFVLCQLRELRFGKEAWKHIILFTYGLLCISSLLLFATSIIWMQEEGPSLTFILLGMFFFTAVIGTAQAAAAVVWKPAALSRFKMKMWRCVIRNSIAPTTLIVNLLLTTLLLHNIQQLHERGCSEAVDLMTSCVFAAAAVVTALLLLFLCCQALQWPGLQGWLASPSGFSKMLAQPLGSHEASQAIDHGKKRKEQMMRSHHTNKSTRVRATMVTHCQLCLAFGKDDQERQLHQHP